MALCICIDTAAVENTVEVSRPGFKSVDADFFDAGNDENQHQLSSAIWMNWAFKGIHLGSF
jgi:hypothetical protein